MPYPSDLTFAEWQLVKHLFDVGPYGKSRKHPLKRLLNAVLYVNKTGCQWRFLPKDFPPWQTVYTFFRRAKARGIWEELTTLLVKKSRVQQGRTADPSFSLIDSQSVKTTGASEGRGIDGGKKGQRAKAPHRDRHIGTSVVCEGAPG